MKLRKTKLKQLLTIKLNEATQYGEVTRLMVWYPELHCWIYPDNINDMGIINRLNLANDFYNSTIDMLGLRNSEPGRIAVFLTPSKKYLKRLKVAKKFEKASLKELNKKNKKTRKN